MALAASHMSGADVRRLFEKEAIIPGVNSIVISDTGMPQRNTAAMPVAIFLGSTQHSDIMAY